MLIDTLADILATMCNDIASIDGSRTGVAHQHSTTFLARACSLSPKSIVLLRYAQVALESGRESYILVFSHLAVPSLRFIDSRFASHFFCCCKHASSVPQVHLPSLEPCFVLQCRITLQTRAKALPSPKFPNVPVEGEGRGDDCDLTYIPTHDDVSQESRWERNPASALCHRMQILARNAVHLLRSAKDPQKRKGNRGTRRWGEFLGGFFSPRREKGKQQPLVHQRTFKCGGRWTTSINFHRLRLVLEAVF